MTESSPQNCSTVAVAVNTLLVSLMLCFIAARHMPAYSRYIFLLSTILYSLPRPFVSVRLRLDANARARSHSDHIPSNLR